MNKKLLLLLLCITTITASTLAVYSQISATSQSQNNSNIQSVDDPSELIMYRHVFSHIASLKKEGDELAAKGEDGAKVRGLYKHAAQLSDQQSELLEVIALDCLRNVEQQDKKAFKIIDAFNEKLKNLKPTDARPSPPAELGVLQTERDAMFLRSRDLLREALGDGEFSRFDSFLKDKMNFKIERKSATDFQNSNTITH